jgi:4'-phosphopantetheinyl transferase
MSVEIKALRISVWWSAPIADRGEPPPLLDDAERERWASLRRAADRAEFAAGRVLARRAVGVLLGVEPAEVRLHARCPICGGAHGKPVVVGRPEIGLSIAHAGERVGVAVADGAQVGLDIEREVPLSDPLNPGAGVLHPLERDHLAALPPARRTHAFLRCWTRKEAVLKATGEALTTAMDALQVSPPDEAPRVLRWPGPAAREVRLHDLEPGAGYAACVAALTALPLHVSERTAGRR